MNSWLRKRVLVFTGTLHLWDIDGRIENLKLAIVKAGWPAAVCRLYTVDEIKSK